MARELNEGMVAKGHSVDVLTTALKDIDSGLSVRTTSADVGGVHVHYLATPARYRWMGVTPSAPVWLRRMDAPDVAHIFGFRDPVGTMVAAWCRMRGVPYVLEPLGMFMPRVRKVQAEAVLDGTLLHWLPSHAAAIVVTSEHERMQVVESGAARERVSSEATDSGAEPRGEDRPEPCGGGSGSVTSR